MAPDNQPLTTLDEADLTNLRTMLAFAATYMTQTMKEDAGRRQYLSESIRLSEKLDCMREEFDRIE